MSSWIDQSARRLLIAGSLAFAVGAPTLACMGGDDAAVEDGDDAGDEEGGDEEAAEDAAAKSLGKWKVRPAPAELRQIRIIAMALNPKVKESRLKEKLKPPPSDEEVALFRDIKKLDPESPEYQFLKMQVKIVKNSRLEITDSKWVLTMGEETQEWTYTVVESDEKSATIKLDSGETNTLTFVKDDRIKVKISDPGGELDLEFVRDKGE